MNKGEPKRAVIRYSITKSGIEIVNALNKLDSAIRHYIIKDNVGAEPP